MVEVVLDPVRGSRSMLNQNDATRGARVRLPPEGSRRQGTHLVRQVPQARGFTGRVGTLDQDLHCLAFRPVEVLALPRQGGVLLTFGLVLILLALLPGLRRPDRAARVAGLACALVARAITPDEL